MEYLAFVYTLLLVAICLMMAVLLARTSRLLKEPKDDEALKSWLEQQLAAQAKDFSARQDAVAQQNYAAIRSVSETLQTAVQGMSTTLGQGQDSQQRILEQRLRSLEQANTQQMEQLRQAVTQSMATLQAENARKLDEIRHTVDEQLQDALQKRVTESFKAVNQQLEQVYKGLGEMQSLAADVGGLKQVLSGVKTRGILGEIQLGAILEEILAPEQYDTNVAPAASTSAAFSWCTPLVGMMRRNGIGPSTARTKPAMSAGPGNSFCHAAPMRYACNSSVGVKQPGNIATSRSRAAAMICGSSTGDTRNFAPAPTAASTASRSSTVPAPTTSPGRRANSAISS